MSIFRGIFIGPGWLRRSWGPLLAITGLGDWWGKDFDYLGKAINLVLRKGRYQRIYTMEASIRSAVNHGQVKPAFCRHGYRLVP